MAKKKAAKLKPKKQEAEKAMSETECQRELERQRENAARYTINILRQSLVDGQEHDVLSGGCYVSEALRFLTNRIVYTADQLRVVRETYGTGVGITIDDAIADIERSLSDSASRTEDKPMSNAAWQREIARKQKDAVRHALNILRDLLVECEKDGMLNASSHVREVFDCLIARVIDAAAKLDAIKLTFAAVMDATIEDTINDAERWLAKT